MVRHHRMPSAITVVIISMLLGLSTVSLAKGTTRVPEFTCLHLDANGTDTVEAPEDTYGQQHCKEVFHPPARMSELSDDLESNGTFTGRKTVTALMSPNGEFELTLIQDGFGTSMGFQYCWAEVHDSATGSRVKWREPCNPLKVDSCVLAFIKGDFLLEQSGVDFNAVVFLTPKNVTDDTQRYISLTDKGGLEIVTANDLTVWRASDDKYGHQHCKGVFHPSNGIGSGSRLMRFSWFGAAFAAFFILVLSS